MAFGGQAGRFEHVPLVTGTNTDEGVAFTLPSTTVVPALLHKAAALCSGAGWPSSLCYLPAATPVLRKRLLELYPAQGHGLEDLGNAANI